MAAKSFWTRAQADQLIDSLLPAFSEGSVYDVAEGIDRTIVCGDIRRDPSVTAVKHLCVVGVVRDMGNGVEINIPDIRGKIKANVQSVYHGAPIRNYKLYDFVELPDGSGNVSWLVVPEKQAGAATLHATGPVMFCKMVEMFAESVGLTFGASGIKRGDEKMVTLDEQAVFKEIGATFVALNERETARYLDPV